MKSNFLRLSAALVIVALLLLASTAGVEVQASQHGQATGTAGAITVSTSAPKAGTAGAAATAADEGAFPPCPDVIPAPTKEATVAATKGATTAATKATVAATTRATTAATVKATTAATKGATAAAGKVTPTAITMGSMTVGPFQTMSGSCTLQAAMRGPNEVPQPGPAKARGTATVVISRPKTGPGTICVLMTAFNIKLPATASHIHRGPEGVAGPVVVPLQPPDAFGRSSACTTGVDRALIKEILTTPYNFYVNVHTTDFPNGAMRGQLQPPPG